MREKQLATTALVVVVLLAVLAAGVWGCPINWVTGLPCPGCGITRAFILLLHGDIVGSFKMHPMLIPLMVGVAVICLVYFGGTLRTVTTVAMRQRRRPVTTGATLAVSDKGKQANQLIRCIVYVLLVALIVTWLYRLVWCWGVEPMEYHEPNLLKTIYDLVV